MSDNNHMKAQLEEELVLVQYKMQLLDMIEERMIQIRELAQHVVDYELSHMELQAVNEHVNQLEEQIKMLNSEGTELS